MLLENRCVWFITLHVTMLVIILTIFGAKAV